MNQPDLFDRWLYAWVSAVCRHPILVLLIVGAATSGIWAYTKTNLGINTDTADMLSADLPYRQHYSEYQQQFPQFKDNLHIVIDAQTPDLARHAARTLAQQLQTSPLVEWVWLANNDPFFEQHSLLYLDEKELGDLSDNLARVQPFLGKLTTDPNLYGLFSMLNSAIDAKRDGDTIEMNRFLIHMAESFAAVSEGRFHQLSWQGLMLDAEFSATDKRSIIVVHPQLDYSELLPAGPVIDAIHAQAAKLGFDPLHGVSVRVTGGLALAHDELTSASEGAKIAGVLALFMVTFILMRGLGSWRLVVASMLTLITGLIGTAGFAAASIGSLNLISVAFAVLYIGLGIDYAIHFSLRYRELRYQGHANHPALSTAARDVGRSLALCTITTGLGFYAFVPTDFTGVSELGLIGGTGMFISLFASLTVLPAVLSLLPINPPDTVTTANSTRRALLPIRPGLVISLAGIVTTVAVIAASQIYFDRNPLNLRDPEAESVQAFRDLLDDSDSSPWPITVLASDADHAEKLSEQLEALSLVDSTRSIESFIPDHQLSKLELIDELGLITGPLLTSTHTTARNNGDYLTALTALLANIDDLLSQPIDDPFRDSVGTFYQFARHFEQLVRSDPKKYERLLPELNQSLLGAFPAQLEQLRQALDTDLIDADGIPEHIRNRWVGTNQKHRIAVYANTDLEHNSALAEFVEQVRSVAPNATDSPVIMAESASAVVGAFRQAFVSAGFIIVFLLLILLRRKSDVLLVVMPLLMAGALTIASMVLLNIPFNFANVIALPLILGVGVDSGIHMVHRYRSNQLAFGDILHTSTTRAVILSALTTIFSFGNLALSSHPGMASMGQVLTLGIGFTLISTLVLLPALLAASTEGTSET